MNQQPVSPGGPQGGSSTMKQLLIILVVVIVLGGGYLLYNKYGKTSTTTASPSPASTIKASPSTTAAVSPSASSAVPADWKTYTNSVNGYSIKYPADYTATESSSKNILFNPKGSNGSGYAVLNIMVSSASKDLAAIIQDKVTGQTASNCATTQLAGESAYECMDLGMSSAYVIFTTNNNNLFELLFNTGGKTTFQQNKAALTDIQTTMLSTFQFTNH